KLEGWSVAPPQGAFYAFPRVQPANDVELVRGLVLKEGVVLVHGAGFGRPGFVRIVFLPPEATLHTAFDRIGRFLGG
ncbi:MAG: aminotransferase class I/II-fold pyridoxal phosphate-dependent enzyme, partial [Deltaproteobacteria bacterium]|nr:aminotransferase class I/II-fold pyridoxal phosphate-dependent enzyme [Deltaproteobacteria bacterium]